MFIVKSAQSDLRLSFTAHLVIIAFLNISNNLFIDAILYDSLSLSLFVLFPTCEPMSLVHRLLNAYPNPPILFEPRSTSIIRNNERHETQLAAHKLVLTF